MTDIEMVTRPTEISVEEMQSRLAKFAELKTAVLEGHTMEIHGKKYILKSGWRVAATVFGIADEITFHERQDRDDGTWTITYHVKCTDPAGRTSMGIGSCDSKEKSGNRIEHDVATMAHTRAKNRAISDLIGTGEVSAEEMMTNDPKPQSTLKPFPSRFSGTCKHCEAQWAAGTNIFKVNSHWCVNPKCVPKMQSADNTEKKSNEDKPTVPTPEQEAQLKELKYDGLPPRTRYEAAIAITEMQQRQKEKQQADQIRQAQEAQNE